MTRSLLWVSSGGVKRHPNGTRRGNRQAVNASIERSSVGITHSHVCRCPLIVASSVKGLCMTSPSYAKPVFLA